VASALARITLIAAFLGSCVTAHATAEPDFRSWRALRDQGVVKQSLDFSCGAAALATLLNRHLGTGVTERELLGLLADPPQGLPLPRDWRDSGMSFATLSGLVHHYGATAVGIELSAADLSRLRVPAIAYLPNSDPPHFTVITGIDPRGSIELADPAWGNRRLRGARFNRLWLDDSTGRGRLMLLHPDAPRESMPTLALQRLYPLVRASHRPSLIR
jgi:predicted double-glycine peptidase